jgi:hypothetical protein
MPAENAILSKRRVYRRRKIMAETKVPPEYRGLTFEDVWAALMEDREQMNKSREEAELRSKKIDKQLEETGRFIDSVGKQMGDLHNRFGELAEHLVLPSIVKRFNELGYHFKRDSGTHRIYREDGSIKAQIDILLENDNYIIAIEVKVKPLVKDIEPHMKRLEILREDRDKEHDNKKILGAIAGAIFGQLEKKAVLEAGMYVLEQSGDTMRIEAPDGKPHEW